MFKYFSPISKSALNVRFHAFKYLREKVKIKKAKTKIMEVSTPGDVLSSRED